MLDASEVGLCWKRKQARPGWSSQQRLGSVQPQFVVERCVLNGRAASARHLANAVHRVVVVGRQYEARPGSERECFADQSHCSARVRRKYNVVLSWIGVEELERLAPRVLDDLRAS